MGDTSLLQRDIAVFISEHDTSGSTTGHDFQIRADLSVVMPAAVSKADNATSLATLGSGKALRPSIFRITSNDREGDS